MLAIFRTIKISSLVLLVICLLSPLSLTRAQQEAIDDHFKTECIFPSTHRKLQIAITDLVPQKQGDSVDKNATYLPERLRANLGMMGSFDSIDKRIFMEMNPRAGIDSDAPLDFSVWTRIGADYLVKGSIDLSGSRVTLKMWLFDVSLGKLLFCREYGESAESAHKISNRFTNDFLEAITGVRGVFGSQIIFVSGTKADKSIMMTEFGSDEATQLAGHENGPSTQPTMGPGGKTAWIHRNNKQWELLLDGKVISSGSLHLTPAFRPEDGSLVAAVSEDDQTNIYAFNGENKTLLAGGGGINVSPAFSPDGSRMVYVSDQDGSASLYIAPAGGGAPTRLTAGAKATDPSWSPTGELITFVIKETDICIIRPDGTGFRQLTGRQGINTRPSFSPDGRMIVFSSNRKGREQLFVMATNGDKPQPLMPGYDKHQNMPFWCPTMPKNFWNSPMLKPSKFDSGYYYAPIINSEPGESKGQWEFTMGSMF